MTILLPSTSRVKEAIQHIRSTDRYTQYSEHGTDKYYIKRFWVWNRQHEGCITSFVDNQPVQWLKSGIEIELLDNGVTIYQITRTGTSGEISLTGYMATQSNIETAIKIAMKGTN
jgi:hypothetical protein